MRNGLKLAAAGVLIAAGAAAAQAGNVVLTGHDADYHSTKGSGGDATLSAIYATNAQRIIRKTVAFAAGNRTDGIKVLLVARTVTNPAPGEDESDSLAGVITAFGASDGFPAITNYTLDVADNNVAEAATSVTRNSLPYTRKLLTGSGAVDFSGYDVILVGSNYGGWLTNTEVDGLFARQADLVTYLNASTTHGVVALAEIAVVPRDVNTGARDVTTPYKFLPIPVDAIDENVNESNYTVAGNPVLLSDDDVNGNFSHTAFSMTPVGWHAIDFRDPGTPSDASDDRTITIYTQEQFNSGGTVDPQGGGDCAFSGCGVTFGAASSFQVFQFRDDDNHGENLHIHSSEVGGIVAVAGPCKLESNNSTLDEDLLADTTDGASVKLKKTTLGGTQSSVDLTPAESDAREAIADAAALPNQVDLGKKLKVGKKAGTYQLDSTGECNVYSVGELKFDNVTLTLNGAAGDHFVFNISKHMDIHKCTVVLTGGITHENVLWNFPTKDGDCHIEQSTWQGTISTFDGHVHLHRSTLHGTIFAGEDIDIHDSLVDCP